MQARMALLPSSHLLAMTNRVNYSGMRAMIAKTNHQGDVIARYEAICGLPF